MTMMMMMMMTDLNHCRTAKGAALGFLVSGMQVPKLGDHPSDCEELQVTTSHQHQAARRVRKLHVTLEEDRQEPEA